MPERTLRIAAVQMQAEMGDVAPNLRKAERLVHKAFQRGAEWVILPEFFTSAMAFHPKMLDAACPLDGEPLQFLVAAAKEYGGGVGGSFIGARGDKCFNTFAASFS